MTRPIAVFGPAHVGKSTLTGWLWANSGNMVKFRRDILRLSILPSYEPAQKFAYVVDTHKDEREGVGGPGAARQRGRSRYTHYKTINLAGKDIMVIDTPGAEHEFHERIRGIYQGDIGVFMIEASMTRKLLHWDRLSTLHKFITPLVLWLRFKKRSQPLVVISKMDEVGFSERAFVDAKETILKICQEDSYGMKILAVPTAIEVDEEKEHNVRKKSAQMPWYSGPTFEDALKEVTESALRFEHKAPLFIYVDRVFNPPGVGRVWRGKILKGTVRSGAYVKITPITYKNDIQAYCTGRIEKIRVGGTDQKVVDQGNIVSLDLRDIRLADRRIDKNDFGTLRTSCVVDMDSDCACGNILQFRMSEQELSFLDELHFGELLTIVWFGRLIGATVLAKKLRTRDGAVTVWLKESAASLPMRGKGQFSFTEFLLKRGSQEESQFRTAHLQRLGRLRRLIIKASDDNDKDEISRNLGSLEYATTANGLEILEESLSVTIRHLRKLRRTFGGLAGLCERFVVEIKDQ